MATDRLGTSGVIKDVSEMGACRQASAGGDMRTDGSRMKPGCGDVNNAAADVYAAIIARELGIRCGRMWDATQRIREGRKSGVLR